MPLEEKTRPARPHSLSLTEREALTVSAVEEVMSFDEQEVVMRTARGLLTVRGAGLKVERLEKTAGELALSGTVNELVYQQARDAAGFWTKLFG